MNEEQIAQQLSAKAEDAHPEPVVSAPEPAAAEPKTVEPESGLTPTEPLDPFVESQNKRTLSDYLGLTPGAYSALQADTELGKIMSFVHQEVGTDKSAILNYIRGIEQAMGTALFTPTQRLKRLTQFVTVRQQARILQQKQEALLG